VVQELIESEEFEIKEMKEINPETTESVAVELDSVEPESEPVEIREEHDVSRHLKITPYKSTEENIGSFYFSDPTSWPNVNDRIKFVWSSIAQIKE
jgi:hypothetical protein